MNGEVPERPPESLAVPNGMLSRVRVADAEQIAGAVSASLNHLSQWLSWVTEEAVDVRVQRRHCREAEERWREGSEFRYLFRLRPSSRVVGGFDLWRTGPDVLELGYWLGVDSTGHGYATACARALTGAAVSLADVSRVEIRTDETNTISAAIPQRLGYRLDRVEQVPPELPAHSGRVQVWITDAVRART